jgi:hypothetical protein
MNKIIMNNDLIILNVVIVIFAIHYENMLVIKLNKIIKIATI